MLTLFLFSFIPSTEAHVPLINTDRQYLYTTYQLECTWSFKQTEGIQNIQKKFCHSVSPSLPSLCVERHHHETTADRVCCACARVSGTVFKHCVNLLATSLDTPCVLIHFVGAQFWLQSMASLFPVHVNDHCQFQI